MLRFIKCFDSFNDETCPFHLRPTFLYSSELLQKSISPPKFHTDEQMDSSQIRAPMIASPVLHLWHLLLLYIYSCIGILLVSYKMECCSCATATKSRDKRTKPSYIYGKLSGLNLTANGMIPRSRYFVAEGRGITVKEKLSRSILGQCQSLFSRMISP
jgi:hypothetical protein